jgi:hypothetical protein
MKIECAGIQKINIFIDKEMKIGESGNQADPPPESCATVMCRCHMTVGHMDSRWT